MKYWRVFIFVIILYSKESFTYPQVIDKVAAVVNDDIILESDINNTLTIVKHSAHKANQQLANDKMLRKQILDQLIVDNIILQLAQRANITISNEQLDQVIGNIAAHNHMTIDQLNNSLAHDNINYNTYRTQIRKEMLIAKVRNNEVRRRITILPQEIESLAQLIAAKSSNGIELKLSHILIPLPENPSDDKVNKAKMLANYLVEQSKNGAEFSKLAITYSSDQQELKKDQMVWRKLEELPLLFVAYLHNAQKGSIIGPIFSDIGFYILKINDIRNSNKKITTNEVHLRHILLRTSIMMTDQQAYIKLKNIAVQIKSGRISFSTAAKQLSEDTDSSSQGGDLGWISIHTFEPAFRNAIINLKKGEISKPVHSSLGWHLIQLIDSRQANSVDTAQKDYAYRLLFNRKFIEEAQAWMQEQRASAYIKIIDNNEQ